MGSTLDAMWKLMLLLLAVVGQSVMARERIFDLPIVAGQTFQEEDFAGLLPTPVFDVRSDFTMEAVMEARTANPGYAVKGKLERFSSNISEEIPGDDMFGTVSFDFAPGGKQLESISLMIEMVQPSRGRVERLYRSLERLLGPPVRLEQRWLYERLEPDTLHMIWKKDGNRLALQMKKDEIGFDAELIYYPGEQNAPFRRMSTSCRQIASEDPAASFKAFLDRVAILSPGDVPPVVPKPAADEADRFLQYDQARVLRFGRRWRLQDKPLIAELNKVLAAEYMKLGPQGTCDHLLAIIRSEGPAVKDLQMCRGAEAYLASLDTPEAIEGMFEVLKPKSGPLLSGPAVEGLASRCKGEVLDRVMRMMDEGGKSADQAAAILEWIRSAELRVKAGWKIKTLKSEAARERAAFSLHRAKGLPPLE